MNHRNRAALSAKASTKQRQREQLAMDHFRPRALARALAACSMLSLLGTGAVQAQALPTGATVTSGQASIVTNGNRMTVTNSNGAIIDWRSFSIGAGQAVRFDQANASSQVLNRVVGNDPSSILGSLSSNGKVWLLNPNGVLFGQGARVDVAGLVASTLSLSNTDWMAGTYRLAGNAGSVVNQGELKAPEGGSLALIAPLVRNSGVLSAPGGSVLLVAADAVTITPTSSGQIAFAVDQGSLQAMVDNGGLIRADGGRVVLTARGVDGLSKAIVNHSGVIEARTLGLRNGVVELLADTESGTVRMDGRIDASAPDGGPGGFVDTSAARVAIGDAARVSTASASGAHGTWVIDPTNFNITSGSGALETAGVGAQALSSSLEVGNVTIRTSAAGSEAGDINVNAPVTWAANTTLSLQAHGNIVINESISASGASAGLTLGHGASGNYQLAGSAKVNLPGANPVLKIGVSGSESTYTVVNTVQALQAINNGLSGSYALGSDIDASSTASLNGGAGFLPIGNVTDFSGRIDGLNHSISGLTINRPTMDDVGFISASNGARVRDLGLVGVNIIGRHSVGGVVGSPTGATSLFRVFTTGRIASRDICAGGLVGHSGSVSINQSYSAATVSADGGRVGGLVGHLSQGSITNSYAIGDVSRGSAASLNIEVGGLVGYCSASSVVNSFATGRLSAAGQAIVGGLIGAQASSTVVSSYWDTQTTGLTTSAGGSGKTTQDMKRQLTFSGWDFTNIWRIVEGGSYPMLRPLTQGKINLQLIAGNATKVYDASPVNTRADLEALGFRVTSVGLTAGDTLEGLGSLALGGTWLGAVNANTAANPSYSIVPGGLASQKYEIAYQPGTLTITPRPLSITADDATKVFGSTLSFTGSEFTPRGLAGGESIGRVDLASLGASSTASVAGGPYPIIPSNASGGSFDPNNYTVTYLNGALTVTPASLQAVLANIVGNPTKTYDGTNVASLTSANFSLSGFVGTDAATVTKATGQYDNVNAGARVVTAELARTDFAGAGTTDLRNYVLPTTASGPGTIVPKTLTPVNLTSANKVYDGSAAAGNISYERFDGLVGNESFAASFTGRFDSKDVGTTKPVTLQMANGAAGNGFLASNYTIAASALVTWADITPAPLSIVANDANKTFGSTVSFAGTEFTSRGLVAGEQVDRVTLTSPGAAATASVAGGPYPITPSNAAGGSFDPRNYAVSYVDGRLTVNRAELSAVLADIVGNPTKAYDGNNTATLAPGNFRVSGFVSGDGAAVTQTTGHYDSADAGSRTVTATLSRADYAAVGSTDLNNYQLPTTATGAGTIIPKTLSLAGLRAVDKVYDGSAAALLASTGSLVGLVSGETLGLASGSARFDTKDAGTGKTVSVDGLSLSDGSGRAANYVLPATATTTASITPAPVTVVALDASKTYGSSLSFNGSEFRTSAMVGSDQVGSVTLSSAGASASASVAGGPYAVTPSAATGSSFDPRNYRFDYVDGKLTVNPAQLSATAVSVVGNPTKTYDGSNAAVLAPSQFAVNGFVAGEGATIIETQGRYDSANAGARTVTVTLEPNDFAPLAGTDLRNYLLPVSAAGAGAIQPKPVTVVGAVADSKTYDGTTAATLNRPGTLDGLVPGQTLVLTPGTARFEDKDAGTGKRVVISGLEIADGPGGLASNYRLASPTASTSADIRPATLVYTASPANSVSGGALPPLSGTVGGFVAGETVTTATTGTLAFNTTATTSSPTGAYPINGSGLAAVNYVFTQAPANATALTLSPPPAAVSQGTSVVLAATAQQIALPVAPTSPTEGRTLDAVQAVPAGASSDKGLSFRSVSIGDMSQDALAALLASRDQFKKSLFATSLSKLEQDPTLADVRDCKDAKQLEQGTCLITEQLKAELVDARRLVAQAAEPNPALPPPGAGAGSQASRTPSAPEPSAAAVAAMTEKLLQGVSAADRRAAAAAAKRRVVKAAVPQIARKLALVIGVDTYADKRIPQLDNAVNDARAVAKLLESSLGYEAVVIPNASKEGIVAALNKLAAEVDSNDSVIVYYAGHGAVVESTGLGYWQPANAAADKPETWLSNADITKLISQIGASQVALVSDSCYSGSLVSSQRIRATTATSPQQFLSQKSVVIMASGGNEPVFDSGRGGHSPFAWNLMRALENVSSWQAGGNVFERVRFAVARELPQRPQYGAVSEAGHQVGGDYLFEQRELGAREE